VGQAGAVAQNDQPPKEEKKKKGFFSKIGGFFKGNGDKDKNQ
jgi:hypothetical protein